MTSDEVTGPTEARAGEPLTAEFHSQAPVDLRRTMRSLQHGPGDPAFRLRTDGVWLARRTNAGPATLRIWRAATESTAGVAEIRARAWGPGSEEALAAVPGLAGLLDDPGAFVTDHPFLRDLSRRFTGLRMPRTGQLMPPLIAAVTGQKVTAMEAHAAWAGLLRRFGEPAPGPAGIRLMLPPTAEGLATLPYFELHSVGLERRRAELLTRIGRRGPEIARLIDLAPSDALERLQRIPGVGPWTAAETVRVAFGDPDTVSVGDAHLPDLVSWALAREPRGDDARMLELLAPFAGQRARVIGLLRVSGIDIPRFGPRFSPRRIRDI